jgi:uncharacterized damage-inducible protein DinB
MNDKILCEQLVKLLKGEGAHVSSEEALKNVNPKIRSERPSKNSHSIWELLEHLRIAQEDILRYTLEESWVSPKWPEGYWPSPDIDPTDEMWDNSVAAFLSDLDELVQAIKNKDIDLTSPIPHAKHHTYLREILLVCDHNSYHIGQILETRKLLGDWKR